MCAHPFRTPQSLPLRPLSRIMYSHSRLALLLMPGRSRYAAAALGTRNVNIYETRNAR